MRRWSKKTKKKSKRKAGHKAELFRLKGPWEDRVSDLLKAKKPAGGWPKA